MNKLSLKVEVEIDKFEKRTRDLLITAFEGGVGYWCQIERYVYPPGTNAASYKYEPNKPRLCDQCDAVLVCPPDSNVEACPTHGHVGYGKDDPSCIGRLQPFECPTYCGFSGLKGDKCPKHPGETLKHDYTPRYALVPTLKGGAVIVSDEESGDEHREYTVDYYALVKAWQIVAELYPHVFARIKEENYDASDADVWFQCAVFGEALYG